MASKDFRRHGSVCFEARDGLYWLRGSDLKTAASVLGLAFESDAVGFDRETVQLHIIGLLKRHVSVFCKTGATVRCLRLGQIRKAAKLQGSLLWLSPDALLGARELARLERCAHKRSALRDLTALMKTTLAEVKAFETVYVYLAGADWYEVDWELTGISEQRFQALALAAHESGRKISCRVVPPKPRRSSGSNRSSTFVVGKPVTYGQLQLTI